VLLLLLGTASGLWAIPTVSMPEVVASEFVSNGLSFKLKSVRHSDISQVERCLLYSNL
jgi:hypothetical protein